MAIKDYTEKELKGMSERAKEIANYTDSEWCAEWDRITTIIRERTKKVRENENEH